MPASPIPTVTASWQRIESWLAAYAPTTLDSLQPPASPEEIRDAEEEMGQVFPTELRESLLRHSCQQEHATLLPAGTLIAPFEIAEYYVSGVSFFDEDEWDGDDSTIMMHPQWIPWAAFEGEPMVIDNRPGPNQGRLGAAFIDGVPDFTDWLRSPSLRHYLHTVAESLHTGDPVDARHPAYPFINPEDGELWWDNDPDASYMIPGVPITSVTRLGSRRLND